MDRLTLANNFPQLGRLRRFIRAWADRFLPVQATYSQHGEDVFLLKAIDTKQLDRKEYIYVDIGANHPTSLSNTYALYRLGYSGVTIEPDLELSNLHRQVRPNDICLTVGCGSQPALSKFYTFSTPVLNSFLEQAVQNQPRLIKTTYIPILPVDLMLQDILGRKRILLLSIDVEGLDLEVLRGATKTLENTIWVCIETGINTSEITDLLCESGFLEHAKIGCNVFFKNVN